MDPSLMVAPSVHFGSVRTIPPLAEGAGAGAADPAAGAAFGAALADPAAGAPFDAAPVDPDAAGADGGGAAAAVAAACFFICSSLCFRFAVLRSSSTSSPGPLVVLAPRIERYVSSSWIALAI